MVRTVLLTAAVAAFVGFQMVQIPQLIPWTCGILTFIVFLLWLQLLAWKNWAQEYKQWVDDNCACPAPGDNAPPGEPGWP